MPSSLITGGAGFIGSHLAELLVLEGRDVFLLDNLSTGRRENISHLTSDGRVTLVEGSADDERTVDRLVMQVGEVFHLAAAVGVRNVVEHPVETIETNINCTRVVLHAAARHGKPVLLTSTSEVYGKLDRALFSEDDNLVLGPTNKSRWSYAASKIIDELLGLALHSESGLQIAVVRLFNTIGPRQTGRYGMVVPRFVQQALSGEPITVYGDGSQRRSFTWVGDVVQALPKLVRESRAWGQVFNIGHTQDTSIYELATLVRELTDSDSEIRLVPFEEAYREGFEDLQRRQPNISKIRGLIGYAPTLGLREMLERVIVYHESRVPSAL